MKPDVVCLHSTGASARQWDALSAQLGERFRVHAVDLKAHGKAPAWGASERPSLDAEVDRLDGLLGSLRPGAHLVGHSYGGAVAVRYAIRFPGRVASLALYEPVMFQLVLDASPRDPGVIEAVLVAGDIEAALTAGTSDVAARVFYDYWSGAGSWQRLDAAVRDSISRRMPAVLSCFHSLFADRTTPAQLVGLDLPVLLMGGERSPRSAHSAAAALGALFRRLRQIEFPELGHMGPVTHRDLVNAQIEDFLRMHARPAYRFPACFARGSLMPAGLAWEAS